MRARTGTRVISPERLGRSREGDERERERRSTSAWKVGYWLWRLHPATSETKIVFTLLPRSFSLASDGFTQSQSLAACFAIG